MTLRETLARLAELEQERDGYATAAARSLTDGNMPRAFRAARAHADTERQINDLMNERTTP